MTDRTRLLAGTAAGALVGGLTAYLVFTARGRQLSVAVKPALDELSEVVRELRHGVRKAHDLAREVRSAAEDVRVALAAELSPEH